MLSILALQLWFGLGLVAAQDQSPMSLCTDETCGNCPNALTTERNWLSCMRSLRNRHRSWWQGERVPTNEGEQQNHLLRYWYVEADISPQKNSGQLTNCSQHGRGSDVPSHVCHSPPNEIPCKC
jgi:hypothetical protein